MQDTYELSYGDGIELVENRIDAALLGDESAIQDLYDVFINDIDAFEEATEGHIAWEDILLLMTEPA